MLFPLIGGNVTCFILISEKEKELEDLEKRLRYDTIVADREYAFCIYPEAMLEELFALNGLKDNNIEQKE